MNAFNQTNTNNMNNIAQSQRIACGNAPRRTTLFDRVSSFFKDVIREAKVQVRNAKLLVNKINRNLELASTLVFTYMAALASSALVLGVLFWGVYTFVPGFFWEHFGELVERYNPNEALVLLNGVPMIYQALAALLAVCLCVRVGIPYCKAVLSIQTCLINKDYASLRTVLSDVKAHTNGFVYEYSGFILKCAVAVAVACVILKAAHVM